MNNQKNIFIAALLTVVVWMGVELWRKPSEPPVLQTSAVVIKEPLQPVVQPLDHDASAPSLSCTKVSRKEAMDLTAHDRVVLHSDVIKGSLHLRGATIDDLSLTAYTESETQAGSSTAPHAAHVLSPRGTLKEYYAAFSWELLQGPPDCEMPTAETLWTVEQDPHRTAAADASSEICLHWTNRQGVKFQHHITIDGYMLTIRQSVHNSTPSPLHLRTKSFLERWGPMASQGMLFHEGPIGVFQGHLREVSYEKSMKAANQSLVSLKGPGDTRGWLGITDKYWLSALIPPQGEGSVGRFFAVPGAEPRYRTECFSPLVEVPAGGTYSSTSGFFVGPKDLQILEKYEKKYNLCHLDLAVDFGWFYFLTRPFFSMLSFLKDLGGSFGFAILAMTVVIRLLFLPLAIKSQRSMAGLKNIQPKMAALKERFGSDKLRLNQEIMLLYKKEGVSPVSGCLPMLVQLPFFFALYKVLFVSIEMRHAPFWGWISDLSAPDPTNLLTLFGLLPWDVPAGFHIGAWPILMGISMWVQQKMNDSAVMDPSQRFMLTYLLPVCFSYMLAQFPVGLVIYWTWGNVLTIVQQWAIGWWLEKKARTLSPQRGT